MLTDQAVEQTSFTALAVDSSSAIRAIRNSLNVISVTASPFCLGANGAIGAIGAFAHFERYVRLVQKREIAGAFLDQIMGCRTGRCQDAWMRLTPVSASPAGCRQPRPR